MRVAAFVCSAALLLAAPPLPAFIWPSAVERVEKELGSRDIEVRRRAAQRLSELPASVARRLALIALDDPDVEVRLSGADVAQALGVAELGERVVSWLSDSERRLRLAAAEVLRESPSTRAIAALGRALSDSDAAVRAAAAGALGATESSDATLALLGHLDDSMPEVRREVALGLARLGDARAVVPLIGKIEDARPIVRRSVARALGELRDARAVSALVLVLRDADETVRIAALEALGKIGEPSAAPSVIALLEAEPQPLVRASAVQTLGRIASPESLQALVRELGRDAGARERALVVRALSDVGAPAAPLLQKCLSGQPTLDQADGCALALGEIGDASASAALQSALKRTVVRPQMGLLALGALGDHEALPIVLEYLATNDAAARQAALDAAARLLDPRRPDGRAVEPLARALASAQSLRSERMKLVTLLGLTGSPRAGETLLPLAQNADDVELRTLAIEALGKIGPSGQEGVLLEALGNDYGGVRLAAALALRRVGTAPLARVLLDRYERAAEQDRGALALALGGVLGKGSDPAVLARVEHAFSASRGGERDALLEALGCAPTAAERLGALAERAADPADRAKIAESLGQHAEASALLLKLSHDADGAVRANAAWSLGSAGTPRELPRLFELLHDRDVNTAGNAAAAIGLIAARAKLPVAAPLCAALTGTHSYERASALRALRVAGQRCPNSEERRLIARDRADVVREAAALLIASVLPESADRRLLERCAADDPSGSVAAVCANAPEPIPRDVEPFSVFVVPVGETSPVPRAPFALLRADGILRLGVSDRRGAIFEAAAPVGPIALAVPAPLAR